MTSSALREVPMTKQVVESIDALGNKTINWPFDNIKASVILDIFLRKVIIPTAIQNPDAGKRDMCLVRNP